MSYEHLRIEREGQVALVTLDRPDKLNALSLALMREIEAMADEFRADTETRAVVMMGAGKHFTAGADLTDPERAALSQEPMLVRQRVAQLGQRMTAKLHAMPQITIAAINGGALGGGAVIVSALDFRIGSEDCFVAYPEINLGMNLSWHGAALCTRLVGPARAKRMIILGERENAETLCRWGFLDEAVRADRVVDRALEVARAYAAKPPMAAQMIKRSINAISSAMDQAITHMDTDQLMLAMMSKDSREGINAFLEKRPAQFTGE